MIFVFTIIKFFAISWAVAPLVYVPTFAAFVCVNIDCVLVYG